VQRKTRNMAIRERIGGNEARTAARRQRDRFSGSSKRRFALSGIGLGCTVLITPWPSPGLTRFTPPRSLRRITGASRSRSRSLASERASMLGFKLCNYVDRDRTSSLKAPGWHRASITRTLISRDSRAPPPTRHLPLVFYY